MIKDKNVIKRALLMGLNYKGTNNSLNGCINDTENISNFLVNNDYFHKDEIIFMSDDS
jgi:hypothetical protein